MTEDDKALVERLRLYATEAQLGAYYDDDTRQVDQAADRIEVLSAENERLQAQYDEMGNTMLKHIGNSAAEIVRLELENEKLREALELADAALRGANMNMNVVKRKVSAALEETK